MTIYDRIEFVEQSVQTFGNLSRNYNSSVLTGQNPITVAFVSFSMLITYHEIYINDYQVNLITDFLTENFRLGLDTADKVEN